MNITLFSSPTCIKCRLLTQTLEKHNITFDISHDYSELEELRIQYLPVLKVNDKYYNYVEAMNELPKIEEEQHNGTKQ